jgi:hypothetical protein
LKWLPIVFVRLIQSQRIVTVTVKYSTATARLRIWTEPHCFVFFNSFPIRVPGFGRLDVDLEYICSCQCESQQNRVSQHWIYMIA